MQQCNNLQLVKAMKKKKKKLEKKSSKVLSCSTHLCLFCFQAVGVAAGQGRTPSATPGTNEGLRHVS